MASHGQFLFWFLMISSTPRKRLQVCIINHFCCSCSPGGISLVNGPVRTPDASGDINILNSRTVTVPPLPQTPTPSSARWTRYIVCVCFIFSLKLRPQNNDDISRNLYRQHELVPSALIQFKKRKKGKKKAHRLLTTRALLSGYDASRFSTCGAAAVCSSLVFLLNILLV